MGEQRRWKQRRGAKDVGYVEHDGEGLYPIRVVFESPLVNGTVAHLTMGEASDLAAALVTAVGDGFTAALNRS